MRRPCPRPRCWTTTGSEDQATAAARSVFDANAAKHPELARVMSGADITLQYSNTLEPWAAGSVPANYVRVVADDFTMWTSFTSLVGITETQHRRFRGRRAERARRSDGRQRGMRSCADAGVRGPGGRRARRLGLHREITSRCSNLLRQDREDVGPGNFQLDPAGRAGRQHRAPEPRRRLRPVHRSGRRRGDAAGRRCGSRGTGPEYAIRPVPGRNERQATYPPDKVTTATNPELVVARTA